MSISSYSWLKQSYPTTSEIEALQQGFKYKIDPRRDLVQLTSNQSLEVDVVYAQPESLDNVFGSVYHPRAKMWLHKSLAKVLQEAADELHRTQGWTVICKDGLRPIEAQVRMASYVNEHRYELEKVCASGGIQMSDLISGPGQGAHPRGMAIDVGIEDCRGNDVWMGSVFDQFTSLASRDATDFNLGVEENRKIVENRQILNAAFEKAAQRNHFPLLPLRSEWWDFRATPEYYNQFAPLSDNDLPRSRRMVTPSIRDGIASLLFSDSLPYDKGYIPLTEENLLELECGSR